MKQRQSIAQAIQQASQDAVPSEPTTVQLFKKARTREGKKMIAAPVDPAGRKTLKILAAELDRNSEDLIREALGDLFTKYGKPRIV
jgi:hypothetical protein